MKPADRQMLFERLQAQNPSPKTELQYQTPFQLLVAVILSAQATDRGVNLATRPLFAVSPSGSRQPSALGTMSSWWFPRWATPPTN